MHVSDDQVKEAGEEHRDGVIAPKDQVGVAATEDLVEVGSGRAMSVLR
jgi:hypothetical protein